jgi:adenylate cyclase, class 2
MPQNLEIKAMIPSVERAKAVAYSLNARLVEELHQIDTYFDVQHCRLKLREVNQAGAELIYYDRTEASKQRVSQFEIFPCSNPSLLKIMLGKAIGIKTVVEKKRLLFLYKSTRIHLDEVIHLGSFLELETPIESSIEAAIEVTNFLERKFDINESDYVLNSYLDLLLQQTSCQKAMETRRVPTNR